MKTILSSPTPNLQASRTFYSTLHFTELTRSNYFTDGKTIIEIDENRFARPGIKLFAPSWSNEVEKLAKCTKVNSIEHGYLLGDSSGTRIYLIESDDHFEIPVDCPPSFLGNNQGLTIEVLDIENATQIWELIGFKSVAGNLEQGWMSLVNGDGVVVNLMIPNCCPHLFLNPSISYFNGEENSNVIAKIRTLKLEIKEEITHFNKENKVDNIILSDPGNIGFFIFND